MGQYDNYSRDDLIRRIEELETLKAGASSGGRFRERYAFKILDSLPDMLTVLTREGAVVELVSAKQTNHVGVPLEQLVGRNIREFLSPEACDHVDTNLRAVFEMGQCGVANHDITVDDKTHNYENRIFPLDSDHALCMCRDITETEVAKGELEMVKYALNNVEEEIYACDLDGIMVFANDRFRQHHDLQENIFHHKVYEFWSFSGNSQQWYERLEKIRQDNGQHSYTVRYKNQQGSVVAYDISAYIILDHQKKREIVWFFGRDVTMRIEHESRVKEMNSIMECVLNNIPVYLFVKDPGNEFRYLYWNRAFEEFSHIPASKAIGHTDLEVFPNPKDAKKFRIDDLALLRSGQRMNFVEEYVNMKGETRIVNTSKSLVPVENRLPLVVGVSWDITDLKSTEMEIVEARIRAEESDRLKSAFLANMSHEIRTPLNAIVGFAKLIGSAESEEEKKQYADIIDTNSDLLLQLINDILDISKIEAGTLEFHCKPMNLRELCHSEYEVHKSRLLPGVQLVFDDSSPDSEIVCDQNRLAQVISNLLNNAAKFTEQGEIHFGYTIQDETVSIYVRDTGSGIPRKKLRDIFDRFIKLNDFAAGSGLGLAISKMIVEHLGGTIYVESEEGVGTRFEVTIPQESKTEYQSGNFKRNECRDRSRNNAAWTLLVAEDSDINFKLVDAVLSSNFRLLRARTGLEAIEMFDTFRPDAVLMELRLPGLNGLEATRRIRALSAGVPIIATSAYAFGDELEAARQAGCTEFLPKPLSQSSLNKALNAHLLDLKS